MPFSNEKMINLWFENEKRLAKYLDKNFENIILNWNKTINSKCYIKLRKTLFVRENFNDSLAVTELLMAAYMSAEQDKTIQFPPEGLEDFVPAVAKGEWNPNK